MIAGLLSLAASAGTLAGRVEDFEGAPVAGASVTVLDPRLAWSETTTDAQGRWEISGLPANPYRVRVLPPDDADVVERYAPSAVALCDGEVFEVEETGRTDGADATLPQGGTLLGRLVDASGQPVGAVTVAAQTEGGRASPRLAVSDGDGGFVIRGVPPDDGLVRIEIDAPDLPDQYLGPTFVDELALAVEVRGGQGMDLGDQVLLSGITVGGTVFGPDGLPVTDGTVTAYTPSQLRSVPVEPDGTWQVRGLPPGDVLAWAQVQGLATTYWPDQDRPTDRLPVLQEGAVQGGMDLILPAESRLVGHLLGDVDWGGASVLLYNSDRTVGFAGLPGADGSFVVEGIHGGTYTVFVNAEEQGFVADFLRDGSVELAVQVPDEAALDLGDVALPVGASIQGVIVDEVRGRPVFGATVYAEAESFPDIELGIVQQDGSYRIGGLPEGAWRLWVAYASTCPEDPGYVTIHHPQEPNPAFALPLVVDAGDERTWDVDLPPDDDQDGMSDPWEISYDLDPERDDGALDPDQDGYSNLEEYLLGTDPRDAARGCGCGSAGGPAAVLGTWTAGLVLLRRRQPIVGPRGP